MSSLPPSPRSRASLARVAYGEQEELKARRIVCPADRGAARLPRLNSRLVARAHLGRSRCAPSPVRLRPAQPAGAQPAAGWRPTPLRHPLAEYAIHAIGTTARSAGPPRAVRPGFHSGRGGRLDDYNSSTRTSIAKQRRDHIRREPPRRRPAGATSLRSLACSPRSRLQTGATIRWRRAVRAPGRDADDSEAVQAPSKMRTTPRPSPEAPAQADIVACQNSSAAGCSTRAAAAAGSELYQRARLS